MGHYKIFESLNKITTKPQAYTHYTTPELWCEPHIAAQMLALHLNPDVELASRKKDFIDRSTKWIANYFKIDDGKQVCDFGCGPGLYTLPFAQQGANVTGIDFSANSIAYAQKQAAEHRLVIDYLCQDYLAFTTEKRFDLITMITCDFCALSPQQRSLLLKKFHALLKDDGSILLDVNASARYAGRAAGGNYESHATGGFWSPDPHYVFHNCFKYEKELLLLDKFTIIEATRTREFYNWSQCYTLQDLAKEFAQNGLQITEHFANVAGDAYTAQSQEIAVVAKK